MKNQIRLIVICLVLSLINMKMNEVKHKHSLKDPKNKESKKMQMRLNKQQNKQQKTMSKAQRMKEAKEEVEDSREKGIEVASQIIASREQIDDDFKDNSPLFNFFKQTYDSSDLYQKDVKAYGGVGKAIIKKDDWVTIKMKKAQKVYSSLQYGMKVANKVADKVKSFTGNEGLQTIIKCLGPYGTIISLGMELVDFFVIVKDKGFSQALIQTFTEPTKADKMLIAIEQLSGKIDSLSEKMTDMFSKLDQQNELNIAKQNAFQSVEIILFAMQKFQDMQNDCQKMNKNVDQGDFPFSINKARCELSQNTFVQLMKQLNFDFHYNEILKIYAGDINLMGVDFFTKLSEMYNYDKEILLKHYRYFQSLIRQGTLCLHVFKTLSATFTIRELNAQKVQLQEKNTEQILADELDQIVLTSSCDNCQSLEFDYQLKIATGDAIFCKRIPNICQESDDQVTEEEKKIKEKANELAKNSDYDWGNVIKNQFDLFVQHRDNIKSQQDLAQQIKQVDSAVATQYSQQYFFQIQQLRFKEARLQEETHYQAKNVMNTLDFNAKDNQCNQCLEKQGDDYDIKFQIAYTSEKSTQGYQKRQKIIDEAVKSYLDAYAGYYEAFISLSRYIDCKEHVYESMKEKLEQLDNYQFSCYSQYYFQEGFSNYYAYLTGASGRESLQRRKHVDDLHITERKQPNRYSAAIATKYQPVRIIIIHC